MLSGAQFCVYSLTPQPSKPFLLPHTDSWAMTLPGAWAPVGDATRTARAVHGLSESLSEVQRPNEAGAPGQAGASSPRDSNDCAALPFTHQHPGISWKRLNRMTTPVHHRVRPQDTVQCKVQCSPGTVAASREQSVSWEHVCWLRRRAGDTHCCQSCHITHHRQQSLPQQRGAVRDSPAGVMELRDLHGGTLVLGTQVGRWGWVVAGSCGEALHLLDPLHPEDATPCK